MSAQAVARRYAKALAQIGAENGTLGELQRELDALHDLVKANPDMQRLVFFPLIAPSKRAEALDAVMEKAGASALLRKFFGVVTRAARLMYLPEIVAAFHELVDEKMGVMEARVASAHPLSEANSQRLAHLLSLRTNKRIRIKWGQDPTLLGGLKVQLGSTVYDASLQGQLRMLKAKLLSA